MGNRVYTTTEYGAFAYGKEIPGCQMLPKHTFELLREFVLTEQSADFMKLSCRRGAGEILVAQNYVGVIALPDGSVVQILPKIFSAVQDDDRHTKAKQLLLDMLRTLRGPDCQHLPKSQLDTAKMDILEIFIRMFLDELSRLMQRGVKCGYETAEENLGLFKGKMLFSKHILHNFAHQERCYVAYDQFTPNRPENRLIKSTLLLLQRKAGMVENQKDIKRFLCDLEQVEPSRNVVRDIGQCCFDRSMAYYQEVLGWCRVFLSGRSFSSFEGGERAIALLYPMDKLFESYVAEQLRKTLDAEKYQLIVQGPRRQLIEGVSKFQMRPDITIQRRSDDALLIMDTKWKLIEETNGVLSISQADMYQMYVYQKKYGADNVTLLYPRTNQIAASKEYEYRGEDDFHLFVRFVDLLEMKNSALKLGLKLC